MGTFRGQNLLKLPVRVRGIELGRTADLLLDVEGRRAVGFEVLCGDEAHRFLAFAVADLRDSELAIGSTLMLLEERELAFYRARSRPLAQLRGEVVGRGRQSLGLLVDVVVGAEGALEALVVDGPRGERTVPFDETVRLGARRSAA